MNWKKHGFIWIFVMLLMVVCNFPPTASVPTPTAIMPTSSSTTAVIEATPTTAEVPTESAPIPATSTPLPQPTPTVTHLNRPAEPEGKFQVIHDQTSEKYASQKRAYGGDDFGLDRFERPFTQEMLYLPVVDIQDAELNRVDSTWVYVVIRLMSELGSRKDLIPSYGVELDVDLNNRGEYLIWVNPPFGKEWTTDGVQVWRDLDKNVGGVKPVKNDPSADGDGYEDLFFDQGIGDDPDLAWVRISPQNDNSVEIAFKNTLTGGEKGKFIWLPWADAGMAGPELFELNDHFTLIQAGSPLKEDEKNYPLKELWGVDNTCRGVSGTLPTASMTGTCPNSEPVPSKPEVPAPGNPEKPFTPPIIK